MEIRNILLKTYFSRWRLQNIIMYFFVVRMRMLISHSIFRHWNVIALIKRFIIALWRVGEISSRTRIRNHIIWPIIYTIPKKYTYTVYKVCGMRCRSDWRLLLIKYKRSSTFISLFFALFAPFPFLKWKLSTRMANAYLFVASMSTILV